MEGLQHPACTDPRHLGWMCSTSARTEILEIAFSVGLNLQEHVVSNSKQDVRDHLNELAELATRASGFMGTGFAAEAANLPWTPAQCLCPFLVDRRKSRTWTSMHFGYVL